MLEKTIPKSLKSFIEDELYGKSKSPLKYHKRSASKSIDSNGGKYLNNQILKVENLKCTSSYTIKLDILNEEDKSLSSTIKTESKKISDFFKMNSTHNKSVSYRSHENDIIQNIPSESECEKINENLQIHKFIFDCNVEAIEKLIDRFKLKEDLLKKIVNFTDHRGNKPIFLCILLRSIYKMEELREKLLIILRILIENGAMIRVRNLDNRTPLEEATSNHDFHSVKMLYDQACKNKLQKIKISKEKANLFLQETPDFSFEMKWEVNVPFLSFLCPNDICKVWKQGINARMDYSFISFKNLQTIRSPSSFYYYGESGQSILLNWEKKTWFDQFEPLDEEEKSLIIDDIMNSSRLNSEFKLKNCQISQSISWRGKPIYEKIKEYNSNKYDVKVTTYFDLHNNEKREYYNLDKDVYFDQTKDLDSKLIIVKTIDEMKKNLAENLQVKNDMQKKLIENFGKSKEKTLSASVWIADNFPFKPIYLVNMINSLSSANEFIEKIKEFFKDPEVEKIIKNNGFPIRIRIPLNILVDITVTFYNFRHTNYKGEFDDKFIIPIDAKSISRKDAQDLKTNYNKRLKYINMNL